MRTDYGFKTSFFILFMMLVFSVFVACSGGGGGSDESGDTTPTTTSLSYTGSTSKALVNESNAAEVSSEAANGGIRGTVFDGLASLTGSTEPSATKRNSAFSTAIILQDAILQLKDVSSSSDLDKAVSTRQETINGTCGGYATGSLQFDDVTGSFSGALSFVNYCDSDVFIDGDAEFSGTIDLTTDEYASLTIHFDYLESSDASGSYVFDGSIQMVVQASSITLTMNMYLQDGSNDDVFWINNYQMQVVYYASYMSVTVSGNFYDPDYGYVTLSTQQSLIIDDYTMTPHSGILIASGENGAAGGPTRARLTCYSSALFQVEADTDGDGMYDWESGYLSWDDY